ncbi:MAG: glycoside hydrolase, partial [Halobacteriales archaeon]|nr:glycoside hydrolase [Halobacteriales archaeon]
MSQPRVVSPVLAGLFLLATLSPVLSGLPAAQATPADILHVTGNSTGFGSPGKADWDGYRVPDYEGNPLLVGGSAEPSGGVCWKTSPANPAGKDIFYFKTLTGVGRATWDDAASPPTVAWTDYSRKTVPEVHHVFADPILFTDEETCRTWAGHMEWPAPCTTDMAFRDEAALPVPPGNPVDHWTTTPICQLSANDHQTIGSGSYSRDLPVPLDAAYPHIVYYCGQYPTVNACTESYDGGLTWLSQSPSTPPGQPLNCASLFGHVKVSNAEGYAAIPHSACLNNAGIELSKNNGLTWSAIDVPGIPPTAHFDPGLAWSRTPKPAGNSWLYFAAGLNGGLYASASPDFGATWQGTGRISDAYTGPAGEKITRAEFANVESGDWDRAAVSFLGTTDTTGTNAWTCTGDSRVVWYMYVARTFDAGAHWKVERASGDPVQIGGIWPGGGSEVCRNLLDFNDLDLGSDGRLYVSYADGCVSAYGCADGSSVATSAHDIGTVIRQTTGCSLLSQFDASGSDCVNGSGVETSGPKVAITSPADGATITPGDVTVAGTVNRDAPSGGAGSSSAASPLLLGFGTQSASLIRPTGGQALYFHTTTVPVGNADRLNAGADMVATAPTGAA